MRIIEKETGLPDLRFLPNQQYVQEPKYPQEHKWLEDFVYNPCFINEETSIPSQSWE